MKKPFSSVSTVGILVILWVGCKSSAPTEVTSLPKNVQYFTVVVHSIPVLMNYSQSQIAGANGFGKNFDTSWDSNSQIDMSFGSPNSGMKHCDTLDHGDTIAACFSRTGYYPCTEDTLFGLKYLPDERNSKMSFISVGHNTSETCYGFASGNGSSSYAYFEGFTAYDLPYQLNGDTIIIAAKGSQIRFKDQSFNSYHSSDQGGSTVGESSTSTGVEKVITPLPDSSSILIMISLSK